MNELSGFPLVAPKLTPPLDPQFRPAALARRAYLAAVRASGQSVAVNVALERADGGTSCFATEVFAAGHAASNSNLRHVERWLKFLLWSRGACRVHVVAPQPLFAQLQAYYRETACGRFDAEIMGDKVYDQPFELVSCQQCPEERESSAPLGRHLEGCRIGFDLGASDRKTAAVIDGETVFSEEVEWDPRPQTDPQWHFDQIQDSLKRAAAHLPRVDAIGGSSAGVYVNNRVKIASLFRGVPAAQFRERIRNLFLELQQAWDGIPFDVVNDGEVTALAGSMGLEDNGVLGIAMGSSEAGGYVNLDGNITPWLNELAFAPVDYSPTAPIDEWSGDRGCGALYFSQQCVGRLVDVAGIAVEPSEPLPEQLKRVQALMQAGDYRAEKIYQTIGSYLGYTVAHYADYYDFRHLLLLGRVTSGAGGELILQCAREVLQAEFPETAEQIRLEMPDEKQKRHGQAMVAASLPALP